MKTTDDNYHYDEMDGFMPVDLKHKSRASSRDIWMSVFGTGLSFSQETRKTLFVRKYIRFLYNSEQRKLLVMSSPNDSRDSIFLVKSAPINGLHNASLRELLERELKYDLSVVRVRIPGEQSRSKPNAFIFDLNKAITSKPPHRKEKA